MPLIACGRVGRPHGIRGALRIWPLNPTTDLIAVGRTLRFGHDAEHAQGFAVAATKRDAKGFLVSLVGVSDREAAALLNGMTWFEAREAFPELDDEEIYLADVIGLAVRTETGVNLGKIADIWQAGGTEVLVIDGPLGRHLVPNVEAFVVRLDPAAGEAVIRPIDGLIEGLDADVQ